MKTRTTNIDDSTTNVPWRTRAAVTLAGGERRLGYRLTVLVQDRTIVANVDACEQRISDTCHSHQFTGNIPYE